MTEFEIIYETKGKAKEYAPLGVELYAGCSYGCRYCFVPKTLNISVEEFHANNEPVKDALRKLKRDAELLKEKKDNREILLCFHSDPYQRFMEEDKNITGQAIEILIANNLRFTILTKSGLLGTYHFDLLRGYKKFSFGTTLIFTDPKDAEKWEPHAAKIDFRIQAVEKARDKKIKTWVSLEPVIDPKQALELIEKHHSIVNHWKIGKLNYDPEMEAEVDWIRFRAEVTSLLDSLGADYYLKKSLTDLTDPESQRVDVTKASKTSIQIGAKQMAKPESPWTDGDIPTRKGNCNILVIAPHGHKEDDENTYQLARSLADQLDCYAVVNQKYRKPDGKTVSLKNSLVDLNIWKQAEGFTKTLNEFLVPIQKAKDEIIAKYKSVFILHIHGIRNSNIKTVAGLIEDFKKRPYELQALIGYGQRENDDTRYTASKDKLVIPFIKSLSDLGISSAIAPVEYIIDNKGKKKWYCGNDERRLNQYLCNPKAQVQSIQLEIKKSGFRENEDQAIKTAERLGMAISKIVKTEPKPEHENKIINIDNISPTEIQPAKIEMRKTTSLKHHPLNQLIYGDLNPDDELKTSIQRNGILTPLLISDDDRILSGHRRFLCAKESGIENVPIMVSPLKDELEIEEALINANIQRQKTKEQIAREYMKLKEIEREKAKQRQSAAGGDRKSDESRKSPTQNSAEAISKGESRKKASSKLGISHDTGEKAVKVVLMADGLKKAGKVDEARNLLDTLNNKSVNQAHKDAQNIKGSSIIAKEKGKSTFNKTNENIEWATWTWNPVTGCNHGCKYCYAREMANRFRDNFPNGFNPTFYPERLDAPSNTKFPVSKHIGDRNVFVVSMGDLFGDWVNQEWIDAVLESVRKYPQWNYLFLTKNPKRLVDIEWPDNAWVGTTVDIQARIKPAEEAFEKIKAKVKFLSCEPLSEELTFTNLKVFDWVIIGARSKTSQAPAMQPKREWVQSLIRQAWDAGCEVYCKPNLKAGVKEYPVNVS